MPKESSELWYHFNKKEANRAECSYCKSILSLAGGSTGNLRRHLKNKHPTIPIERCTTSSASRSRSRTPPLPSSAVSAAKPIAVQPTTSRPSTDSSDVSSISQSTFLSEPHSAVSSFLPIISQTSLTSFVDVIKPLSIAKSKLIDMQLLKMICKEYHPFSIVEDKEFIKFVSLLCPGYSLPSRKTLSQSLLPQAFETLSQKVKQELKETAAIALTTDGWTSFNSQSFFAFTAHYLNENTEICSKMLGCIEFSNKHTAENLSALIKDQCREWGINNKIAAVVTDNAYNIVAAIKLCQWRHVPCYAHTLNLIVKAGIKPVEDLVIKLKNMVQFFKKSTHAMAKLNCTQKQMGLPQLKLKQDVPTRWNSTYDMMVRVLSNKTPIMSTLAILENNDFHISPEEWNVMEHVIKVLEIFDEITKEISADKNVTLSKTIILSRTLSNFIKKNKHQKDLPEVIFQMCTIFEQKIDEKLLAREGFELKA